MEIAKKLPTLTVVTHTCKALARNLSKCIKTVEHALTDRCTHKIIELGNDYCELSTARYDALQLDDIVVFVDDDDYISQDSLKHCLTAIENTNAGIAFTNEVSIRNGSKTVNKIDLNYKSMCNGPEAIHHMTAYRRGCVSKRALDLSLKYKCTFEWLARIDAACNSGAVYIPINGYFWVHHSNQTHKSIENITNHRIGIPLIQEELKTWNIPTGTIPTWNINTN